MVCRCRPRLARCKRSSGPRSPSLVAPARRGLVRLWSVVRAVDGSGRCPVLPAGHVERRERSDSDRRVAGGLRDVAWIDDERRDDPRVAGLDGSSVIQWFTAQPVYADKCRRSLRSEWPPTRDERADALWHFVAVVVRVDAVDGERCRSSVQVVADPSGLTVNGAQYVCRRRPEYRTLGQPLITVWRTFAVHCPSRSRRHRRCCRRRTG